MIGLVGLQDHLAGGVGSPRAARDLGEQLEGALRGAKVREGEALVGERDADERHGGNVVPLGDHLSTHQDVDLSSSQAIEHRLHALTGSRVTVEPGDTRLWETLLDDFARSCSVPTPRCWCSLAPHDWQGAWRGAGGNRSSGIEARPALGARSTRRCTRDTRPPCHKPRSARSEKSHDD